MLCTRCAAFVGCWMIHQITNAIASHFRILPSFTAASLEAQTAPSCQFPYLSPKRSQDGGWSSRQVRRWPCPSGSKYARFVRALRMSLSENVPTRVAVCRHTGHERSSHAGLPGGGMFILWRCLR